ncbi:MAG: hypothetical protein GEV05_22150 [Betaproteobacteria bacterium]|nr:hypothetical protein [Betaproteobacteria bacterium]
MARRKISTPAHDGKWTTPSNWYTAALTRVLEGTPCPDFALPAVAKQPKCNTPPIDADTIEALKQLLVLARKGEITGLAFVAQKTNQAAFIVEAVGECRARPVYTRGMVRYLDDALARRTSGGE